MSGDIAQSPARPWNDPARLTVMFVAAFLATLIFHQGMFAILHAAGLIPAPPFPMAPTEPFGVPKVISLALWGGVWGFVFSWVEPKFPRGAGYWIAALLFGAIFPDRKSTRLNSSHSCASRMPSSA